MHITFLRFIALMLVFAASLSVSAQHTSSLLWKITGNGLAQPSYLYGTYHSKEKRAHQFGDSVLAKIQQCEVVAGEIDQLGSLEIDPLGTLGKVMMPPGQSLKTLLSKRKYKRVHDFAKSRLGIFAGMINSVKPFYTMAMVQEIGVEPEMDKTVDEFLLSYGAENGKTVIGLETIEEQLGAIDGIPLSDQAKMLLDYVDNYEEMTRQSKEMMSYYFTQELDKLWAYYAGMQVPGSVDKDLIVTRNHNMAERLEKIMVEKPTFCAVGALHLPGPNGLIQLLQTAGYTVLPLYSDHTGWVPEPLQLKSDLGEKAQDKGFNLVPINQYWEVWFPQEPEVLPAATVAQTGYCSPEGVSPRCVLSFSTVDKAGQNEISQQYLEATFVRPMQLQQKCKALEAGGFAGHELYVDLADKQILRVRALVYKANQVVVLTVSGTPAEVNSSEADRFLSSFRKSLPD